MNAFLPYGRLAQSMAFFSPPGIERLYGRHEQHGIHRRDGVLECGRHRRVVRVVVVAIQRQILERDFRQLEFWRRNSTSAFASKRLIDLVARLPTKYPTLNPAM